MKPEVPDFNFIQQKIRELEAKIGRKKRRPLPKAPSELYPGKPTHLA